MNDPDAAFRNGYGLAERVAYLIAGYIRGTLTEAEHVELDQWVEASEANMRLFEELTDEENIEKGLFWFQHQEAKKEAKEATWQRIRQKIGAEGKRPFYRIFWPYAAAIIVLLAAGILIWKPFSNSKASEPIAAHQKTRGSTLPAGVVLTLSDGRTVQLDPMKAGAVGDGAQVPGAGRLEYTDSALGISGYHTLSVPRGTQYHLTLPDGTKVWLNAQSSLHYPLSFGGQRKVELKGEGYFEVAKDGARPFVVLSGYQQVTVLGTRFNIDSYGEAIKTTLAEGKVRVERGLFTKELRPGEQATADHQAILVRQVAVQEAIGWKEGVFVFRNAPIEKVVEQLQRWYDIEVVYKGKVRGHFNATISRQEKLERLLKVLEGTGYVHFNLQGNQLVIQP